jgi:hypothetical protein
MAGSSAGWSSFPSALALAALSACGSLHAGGGGGGGSAGTGGSGGNGGSSAFGGGYGGGQGTYVESDAGFTFQNIAPMYSPGTPVFERLYGNSKTDVVMADSFGEIQRWDGMAWHLLVQLSSINGLYETPAGNVFATEDTSLDWCTGDCTQMTSWQQEPHTSLTFSGVCGSGTTVYAVGHTKSDGAGVVFKYQDAMNSWEQLSGAAGADKYAACVVAPDGSLYIGADKDIVEVSALGDAKLVDLIGAGTFGLNQWQALTMMGDEVIAVGDSKRIARRAADGTWTVLLNQPNYDVTGWYSVHGVGAHEAFAGGDGRACITCIGDLARIDESPVLTVYQAPPNFLIRDMWIADDNTFFIAGQTNQLSITGDPMVDVIYRATR